MQFPELRRDRIQLAKAQLGWDIIDAGCHVVAEHARQDEWFDKVYDEISECIEKARKEDVEHRKNKPKKVEKELHAIQRKNPCMIREIFQFPPD